MYAVVRTGGKQYRVVKDEVIVVEKLAGEPGGAIELGEVLVLNDGAETTIGAPLVDGARVVADVIEQGKADKLLIFVRRRRKNHRRLRGHRQPITVLRVTDILAKGQEPAPRVAAEPKPKKAAAEDAVAEGATRTSAAKKAAPKKAAGEKKPAARKAAAKKPAKSKE